MREWLYQHLPQLGEVDQAPLLNDLRGWPLHEVERTGTHCILTHRSVLEAIEPPWFEAIHDSGSGSDFYFHAQAIEAGFKSYVDLSCIAGHLQGDYCVGPLDWLVWDKTTTYDGAGKRLKIQIHEED